MSWEKTCRLFGAAGVLVLLWATAGAGASPPAACSQTAHRQFDFWLGDWTVYDWSTHKLAGHNVVTSEFGGCVLQEHWKGVEGSRGSSFNAYDAARKVWHQTWVDDQGQLLLLEGHLVGRAMVLSGTGIGHDGRAFRQRIIWTPLGGGDVRQRWEVSRDGTTWKAVFDGRYTKS